MIELNVCAKKSWFTKSREEIEQPMFCIYEVAVWDWRSRDPFGQKKYRSIKHKSTKVKGKEEDQEEIEHEEFKFYRNVKKVWGWMSRDPFG